MTRSAVGSHLDLARRSDVITWTLAVGEDYPNTDLRIPLSHDSAWCSVLGDFDCPLPEALEQLGGSLVQLPGPPDEVVIVGPPSACLLPLLWLRSIWLEPAARIELHWHLVAPPGTDPGETHAAALSVGMVDHLHCDDEAGALRLWGIRTGVQEPLEGRVFDSMLAILEAWAIRSRSGPIATPDEWTHRMSRALEHCAKSGHKRIALYGAGTHTRAVGSALADSPAEIAAIIDDGVGDQGKHLWGYPIVTRASALSLDLDCVVLSANSIEDKLWQLSTPLRDAGIEVIRLYADGVDLAPDTFARTPGEGTPIAVSRGVRETPKTTQNVLGLLASPPGVGRMLAALDHELLAHDTLLTAVVDPSTGVPPGLNCLHTSCMSLVSLALSWPPSAPLADEPDPELLEHCKAYERAYWRPRPDLDCQIERGIRCAAWIIEDALDRLRPNRVLIWNGEQGIGAICGVICRQRSIPVLFCERAGIAPALAIDPLGVHATSSMLLDDEWRARITGRIDPELVETGKRISEIMLRERRENISVLADHRTNSSLSGCSLVVLPSIEASLDDRPLDICAHAGSPLGDPLRSIEALLQHLPNDLRVILKPHPRDPRPERWACLCANTGVEYDETIAIHNVVRSGIPIATTSQAIAWLAIAAGAPLLSLNMRPYTGTGAVVDAHDSSLLKEAASTIDSLGGQRSDSASRARQLHVLGAYARYTCHTVDPALLDAGIPGVEALRSRILEGARASAGGDPDRWMSELCECGLATA